MPIGFFRRGRVSMHGVDRCLNLVEPRPAESKALSNKRVTLGDQCVVPPTAVLLGEEYEIAGRCRARGAARFGEEHEGEQADDLWFVRHQHHEYASESDCLTTEVVADEVFSRRRRVPLVENE